MTPSRILTAAAASGLLLGVLGATTPAQADDANTLTVVGTSDVFDSHLVQDVIEPKFEAANPGIDLKYVSKGTGAAIEYAKAGTASAMIVHAAALENQFVQDGYSLEPYGRAVFWGDYVLLGPTSDPAGVLGAGGAVTDDITAAFEKVAAAGAQGTANFVSRGGTPGTTVQEHAIWGTTTGVTTCNVSAANGGGASPYNGTGSGCAVAGTYPDWYHATGLTQGPNITAADTCSYAGSGAKSCYVFTDRGTFQYLQSTGQAKGLQVVTRSTTDTAAAKANLLVNSFHAYAINPAEFDAQTAAGINTSAATKFLDYLASPQGQRDVGSYLGASGDAPFLPSATPKVTITSDNPGNLVGRKDLTIAGRLDNRTPGTPALASIKVDLYGAAPAGTTNRAEEPSLLKSTITEADGSFTFTIAPNRSRDYEVRVADVTQVENDQLDPVFADILTGTTQSAGTTTVTGAVKVTKQTVTGRTVRLQGTLSPVSKGDTGRIRFFGGRTGVAADKLSVQKLKDGASTFDVTATLPKGSVKYFVEYQNTGVIETGRSEKFSRTFR